MPWRSICSTLLFALLFTVTGCASPELSKVVTINGKHALSKTCRRERELRKGIDGLSAARRELAPEMKRIESELFRAERTLRASKTARALKNGGYECRAPSQRIPRTPPLLACPEESAALYGLILCQAEDVRDSLICKQINRGPGALPVSLCTELVKLRQGKGRDELERDLQAWFLEWIGDSLHEQGDHGGGLLAQGWAAALRLQGFQSCVNQVAANCRLDHQVWEIEKRSESNKSQLVGLCKSWVGQRESLLLQARDLRQREAALQNELAPLQQEYRTIQTEIRQHSLRCR